MRKIDREKFLLYMQEHNPLSICVDGKLAEWDKAMVAYFEYLKILWSESPRGYIDIPLFMKKHQDISLTEAERICGQKQFCLIRIWDKDDPKRYTQLLNLMHLLSRNAYCYVIESDFRAGLILFDLWLEKQNIKERTEDGSLVNFIINNN